MKLYVYEGATTSRAVMAFCACEPALPVAIRSVDLMRGEHREPHLARLNPNRAVPFLDDDGFLLTEASAILRYLAAKADSPLYPTALRERARVDELIAWFEANFYKDFGYQYVYPQLFPHHSRGSSRADASTITFGLEQAMKRLAVLDGHYLAGGSRYLVGDRLTIADLFAASILSLGELVRFPFQNFANIDRWYRTVTSLDAWIGINHAFAGFVASLEGKQFVRPA